MKVNPDIDVVGGAIEEIDENSNSRGKTIVYPEGPKECYDFFSRRNPHAHPAVLFRKASSRKLVVNIVQNIARTKILCFGWMA